MLLYHGTRANNLASILRDGLRPPRPEDTSHDWVHALTDRSQSAQVFLATKPVAGKGGDPVSFALGWPNKRERYPKAQPGYLIVVDLPHAAFDLIPAVVPNYELDHFMAVNEARRVLLCQTLAVAPVQATEGQIVQSRSWRLSQWCMLSWLAQRFAREGVPLTLAALRAQTRLIVTQRDPALPADMTPHRWHAFLADYSHLVEIAYRDASLAVFERRRHAILLRHGITLPVSIEEDYHCMRCSLCINATFRYGYQIAGLGTDGALQPFLRDWQRQRGGMHPIHGNGSADTMWLPQMGATSTDGQLLMALEALRALTAYHAAYGAEAVTRFFLDHETGNHQPWSWDAWHAAFPAEGTDVAPMWQPGYGRAFTPRDLLRSDRQIMADAIPARYIIGAIRLSDGVRLLHHVRPNRARNETLASNLKRLAMRLRAAYQGTPIVLD